MFFIWCFFLIGTKLFLVQSYDGFNLEKLEYQKRVEEWLNDVDIQLLNSTKEMSKSAWLRSVNSKDLDTSDREYMLNFERNRWKNQVCETPIREDWLTREQRRKIFLICRGPKYDDELLKNLMSTVTTLQDAYNSKICLPYSETFNKAYKNLFKNIDDAPSPGDCVFGEPILENLMKRQDLNYDQLTWIWQFWHDNIGPKIKKPFLSYVQIQNKAAQSNGYKDIGEFWREEVEIPNLEQIAEQLYEEIEPLYVLLHAVIRYKLFEKYGPSVIDPTGPIPVHLLGNMWGQDWSHLIDLIVPTTENLDFNINKRLKKREVTMNEMVSWAEDFYISLGFPKMTEKFWKYSVFEQNETITECHGTAANLYDDGDFRILMCGKATVDDLYTIHHEMGHIQYYKLYEYQPGIYQVGANSAIHESIGDAIVHGVLTPQHLHRLGIFTDADLFNENFEMYLLLYQVLAKIPEIPYALLTDKYRWKIFRGDVDYATLNKEYWELNYFYRGIEPPDVRNESYFDAGAKFHIPDGTPYIRYFLSSIFHMEIFKGLCEYTVFGRNSMNNIDEKVLPFSRCDIYGSKKAGKKLMKMMFQGGKYDWSRLLKEITGYGEISTKPLLKYYNPIYNWLQEYVKINKIYVGW